MEDYFEILKTQDAIKFCKFGTTNHYIPIEIERWQNVDGENRTCNFCNTRNIGDEYHFIIECPAFLEQRKKFTLKYYYQICKILKFSQLMSCTKQSL